MVADVHQPLEFRPSVRFFNASPIGTLGTARQGSNLPARYAVGCSPCTRTSHIDCLKEGDIHPCQLRTKPSQPPAKVTQNIGSTTRFHDLFIDRVVIQSG